MKQLKQNPDINIKRTDEGSSIVVLNKEDKIIEGQIQLDDREKYKPLETPMVIETSRRVKKLIQGETYRRDDKTMAIPHAKSTANTTILHSRKDSQTNMHQLKDRSYRAAKAQRKQPIAKSQKSCLKETTDFINFIEKTRVVENAILVSMDVTIHKHPTGGRNYHYMQSIRNILSKQTFNTEPIPRRYAQTNPKGEFVPICWKKLPPSTRYSYGNKNGSCIC